MKTTKERFWNQLVRDSFSKAGNLRLWYERKMFNWWWSVEANRKFVENIPDDGECYSFVRKGKVRNCTCGKCF